MAEEVECLPSTCEVLSSNPSTTTKKKKKKKTLSQKPPNIKKKGWQGD
jgi:hypothetical protein